MTRDLTGTDFMQPVRDVKGYIKGLEDELEKVSQELAKAEDTRRRLANN